MSWESVQGPCPGECYGRGIRRPIRPGTTWRPRAPETNRARFGFRDRWMIDKSTKYDQIPADERVPLVSLCSQHRVDQRDCVATLDNS
jgi:hypothetical protein